MSGYCAYKRKEQAAKPEAGQCTKSHSVDQAVRNDSIKGWAVIHKEHCDVGAMGA